MVTLHHRAAACLDCRAGTGRHGIAGSAPPLPPESAGDRAVGPLRPRGPAVFIIFGHTHTHTCLFCLVVSHGFHTESRVAVKPNSLRQRGQHCPSMKDGLMQDTGGQAACRHTAFPSYATGHTWRICNSNRDKAVLVSARCFAKCLSFQRKARLS